MLDETAFNIYTDGSSFSSPRRGGIGMRFVTVDDSGFELVEEWAPQGFQSATNNQMELQACIAALREVRRRGLADDFRKIVIHTDSMYVHDNYHNAMFTWPKRHWLRTSGAPVLNADLWKELVREIGKAGCRVQIDWVKGHAKDPHNRAVDKLAKQSARSPLQPPINYVTVRRKTSINPVSPGSVGLSGQKLSIRVVTGEWLRVQKIWRLKYEVISKASPYFRNVDWIYADDLLKPGHSYFVRVNDDMANPRVLKVFKEL